MTLWCVSRTGERAGPRVKHGLGHRSVLEIVRLDVRSLDLTPAPLRHGPHRRVERFRGLPLSCEDMPALDGELLHVVEARAARGRAPCGPGSRARRPPRCRGRGRPTRRDRRHEMSATGPRAGRRRGPRRVTPDRGAETKGRGERDAWKGSGGQVVAGAGAAASDASSDPSASAALVRSSPPMRIPLTKTCGKVGQPLQSLMASRSRQRER